MLQSRQTPALIGIGYDASSSFLRGAAEAPRHIRSALRSPASNGWSETGIDVLAPGALGDAGDVPVSAEADVRAAVIEGVYDLARTGACPIVLGGDHSITYPVLTALSNTHSNLTVLQFDAHPDLYEDFEGNRYSHACQFARILEDGLVKRLVQVGIRTMTGHQRDQARRFGVDVLDMRAWAAGDRPHVGGPVYISIDLDGLDPAFAPGVSHPEPGGLTVRDVLTAIQSLKGEIMGADIVELNPARDVNSLTAGVAAKFVKELAAAMLCGA